MCVRVCVFIYENIVIRLMGNETEGINENNNDEEKGEGNGNIFNGRRIVYRRLTSMRTRHF